VEKLSSEVATVIAKEIDYTNVVGEDSITRFDEKSKKSNNKKRKNKRRKASARSNNGNNSGRKPGNDKPQNSFRKKKR
jgi:hypothetical protein